MKMVELSDAIFQEKSVLKSDSNANDLTSGIYEGVAQGPIVIENSKSKNFHIKESRETNFNLIASSYAKFENCNFSNHVINHSNTLPQLLCSGSSTENKYLEETETPLQRVARLKKEVFDTLNFTNQLVKQCTNNITPCQTTESTMKNQESSVETMNETMQNSLEMLKELNQMRYQLECLSYEPFTKGFPAFSEQKMASKEKSCNVDILNQMAEFLPSNEEDDKLILSSSNLQLVNSSLTEIYDRLNKLKNPNTLKNEPIEENINESTSSFTYEFYTVPESASEVKMVDVLELERRVSNLESSLGIDENSHLSLPYTNIASAIKDIFTSISMMYPDKMERTIEYIKTLNVQLDDFVRTNKRINFQLENSSQDNDQFNLPHDRINKLYSFWSLSRPVVSTLPSIVSRLQDLQSIHQSAASIMKRVSDLEEEYSLVNQTLSTVEDELTELRQSVLTTISWAKDIVQKLEKKVFVDTNTESTSNLPNSFEP
ncbi:dynactin subunit 2-like [Hylaeus volcanicus]|uniref:dynactin subunit 2-like n=1 Tax=Hylaeus volcanicus TaxID=313075 RepID=UPI0023B78A03|nr:dynactin subunit 2-like [Hylaeus volcanicus]